MASKLIGAYEARSKLPELLRGILAGQRYTITSRGKPVADLVPSEQAGTSGARAAVNQMLKFMDQNPRVKDVDVKNLINAGRA